MNVFAEFQSRIAGLHRKADRRGRVAARPRSWPLRRRAAARRGARRPLDQRGDGLRAGSQGRPGRTRARSREGLVADLRLSRMCASAEVAGPGFINIVLKPEVYRNVLHRVLIQGERFGRGRAERGRAGQCRICERQPDRADACRPCARRGVRRRARKPARLRRPRGDARILHQRRRRRRSTCSRARPSCATARRSAKTSARSPRASIPATI